MQALGLVAVAALLLAVAIPAHAAVVEATGVAPETSLGPIGSCASPPCGYINPILDLDFPTKPKCAPAGTETDFSKCVPMLDVNATVRFEGTVRWYWKESEDLTYPPDTQAPIEITFAGVASNPAWLGFTVDPPKYTVTAVDLLDPRYLKPDNSGAAPIVYYWYEKPINVTFTRTGSPDADGRDAIAAKDGLQEVYVRGKSTASGSTFNAGFGGEYFRFNATGLLTAQATSAAAHESPVPWFIPAGALAGVTLLQRQSQLRRRA